MLCYEIWLNNKKLCDCGHEDMDSIQASVFFAQGMPSTHLTVSARLNTTDKLKEDARWASEFMNVGDEVRVIIKECEKPDEPDELRAFSTKLHPIAEKELFCSFCGRSQYKVEKIFQGMGGNICLECAKLCIETP